MDIRNLLNASSVNSIINDHNLPNDIDESKYTRLDSFEYNKNNKKLINYHVVYLDENNKIRYQAESLYSLDNSLRLHPKCSQTFSSAGTILVTAHDKELNNECAFGFIVSARTKNDSYFKNFEIDEDIKPIWNYNQITYLEEKQEFASNHNLLKLK